MEQREAQTKRRRKRLTLVGFILFASGAICYLPLMLFWLWSPKEAHGGTLAYGVISLLLTLFILQLPGAALLVLALPLNIIAVFREPSMRLKVAPAIIAGGLFLYAVFLGYVIMDG